jgi:hypothetical protein
LCHFQQVAIGSAETNASINRAGKQFCVYVAQRSAQLPIDKADHTGEVCAHEPQVFELCPIEVRPVEVRTALRKPAAAIEIR